MIGLYKYISEGLLKGQEETLSSGATDVERIMIEDWLDETLSLMYVTVNDRTACISHDNKINARAFNPWYAYADKELELPAPDYIKFGKVESVSMTMKENVNFADLPHIGSVNELLLKPFADNLDFDLSKLPIDKVKVFEWVYEKSTIVKYPKNTDIDTFVMWTYAVSATCFGHPNYMIGFDKLKGLKCNNLCIPDLIFAAKYNDFNTGYNSMFKAGEVLFDSQPGQMLLKLYDDKSIQFKKLYVYSSSACNYNFYELKKGKNSFTIAKRAKHFA